jgi:hydroxymethylbilane synthase
VRVTVLSRASTLAQRQARVVARALNAAHPDVDVHLATRAAAGDRDTITPLSRFMNKGAFTSDLTEALVAGTADLVVHSWKDLPIEPRQDTVIGATLERADPRDVLLVRRLSITQRPHTLRILTSSPRRAWMLTRSLAPLLPWPVGEIATYDVRGNINTRLRKLIEGGYDGLVVAKAALDRLLAEDPEDAVTPAAVRVLLEHCRWMVLPLRQFPTAPAQGALAVEVAAGNHDLRNRLAAIQHAGTWTDVTMERALLAERGGGCHDAFGATAITRSYGTILSTRGRVDDADQSTWTLVNTPAGPPRAPLCRLWPQPGHDWRAVRRPLPVAQPGLSAFYVTRAEALPAHWAITPHTIVCTAGETTWRSLAERGTWVNACTDGLGDEELPALGALMGGAHAWVRLTHRDASNGPGTLATYEVQRALPDNLSQHSHYFWTSGAEFRRALVRWPEIAGGWHASGPGTTARTIREALGNSDRHSIWLDYDHWVSEVSE